MKKLTVALMCALLDMGIRNALRGQRVNLSFW